MQQFHHQGALKPALPRLPQQNDSFILTKNIQFESIVYNRIFIFFQDVTRIPINGIKLVWIKNICEGVKL